MPGAGGITAMNHSYNVAPKDGTLMHLVHAEVLFETLLSPGVKFNAKDYQLYRPLRRCRLRRHGVEAIRREDARRCQGQGRDVWLDRAPQRDYLGPAMFNRTAGTQFKMIAGYKGTSDIDIALERGEVDGVALSWASVTSVHGQKYANGDIIPVFAVADGRMKAIPDVPSMTEFGRDDAEKTFLGIYTSSGTIGRALVFPPGVPADRVAALRAAYEKTIRDPEFLAEVKQRQILFDPMSGHGPAGLCRQIHEDAGGARRGRGEGLQRIAGDAVSGGAMLNFHAGTLFHRHPEARAVQRRASKDGRRCAGYRPSPQSRSLLPIRKRKSGRGP